MALKFENAHSQTVYIALLWFDENCDPPWRKQGWFAAEPSQTIEIHDDDLQLLPDRNWAWFAQAGYADGPCWSGDLPHDYAIPHNAAFDQCYSDETGCNARYPFKASQFPGGWNGVTIILLAPGTAGQENQGFAWAIPDYLPEAVAFTSGTLGPSTVTASATWTLNNQGFWNFSGSIHESGVLGQDYGFGMTLDVTDSAGNPISVVHTGSVGPNLPLLNPNDSWNDEGFDQRIIDLWPSIVSATSQSGLSVHTDPIQVFEGILEILGVGAAALLIAAGGVLIGGDGKDWTCDSTPTLQPTPDGQGVDVVWTCRPKP